MLVVYAVIIYICRHTYSLLTLLCYVIFGCFARYLIKKKNVDLISPLQGAELVFYIHVHIDGKVKKKIISALQNLPLQDGESVLVLFWAAEEIKKETKKYIYVLTTTLQPFLLSGNNKELHAHQLACLYHKLYVYRDAKEEAAFGLAGKAYLYCTPQQTQNVHECLEDQSLPCVDAIFAKKWGAYAVPVIDSNQCVGVLEFVTDTPRDYSNDITVAKGVLENAGLRTTMQIDSRKRNYICPKERRRKTFTSPINSYNCLNKYFGLSSLCAAKALEGVIKHPLSEGTFRNRCRSVGILEWPCIRKTTQSRSFLTLNHDLIYNQDEVLSGEKIITTIPSAQEIRTKSYASETNDDTRDWNESESEPEPKHAHPSLMAATGDLIENQDTNIDPARVHLDFMDIDHLRADPLWCEKICGWSGEHTMTSDSEAWLSGFDFPYNNVHVANHNSINQDSQGINAPIASLQTSFSSSAIVTFSSSVEDYRLGSMFGCIPGAPAVNESGFEFNPVPSHLTSQLEFDFQKEMDFLEMLCQ